MNIWLRVCKDCGEHYDIDTSKELCPRCRGTEINEEDENGNLLEL